MTTKLFSTAPIFRNALFAFAANVLIFGFSPNAHGQTPSPSPDDKEAKTEKSNPSAEAQSGIKVSFDENAPGVLIIESNGERVRVDATKKTVEQLAAVEPQEKTGEVSSKETAKVETSQAQEEEGSVFDFDEGEEP